MSNVDFSTISEFYTNLLPNACYSFCLYLQSNAIVCALTFRTGLQTVQTIHTRTDFMTRYAPAPFRLRATGILIGATIWINCGFIVVNQECTVLECMCVSSFSRVNNLKTNENETSAGVPDIAHCVQKSMRIVHTLWQSCANCFFCTLDSDGSDWINYDYDSGYGKCMITCSATFECYQRTQIFKTNYNMQVFAQNHR